MPQALRDVVAISRNAWGNYKITTTRRQVHDHTRSATNPEEEKGEQVYSKVTKPIDF